MKYVLVLLALLYSTKAYASCLPSEILQQQITEGGYLSDSRSVVDGFPAELLFTFSGEWAILTYNSPMVWCVVASGHNYRALKARKA